jgi:hypothetical protein
MKQHTFNQSINEKQLKIVESVNLGQLLESSKVTTINGDQVKNAIVENFNNQKLSTISTLIGAANHCVTSRDTSLVVLGNTILEKLNASLEAKLIYCLENVNNIIENSFSVNPLARQLSEKLESILEMSNADQVNSIRSGSLSIYKTVTNLVDWIHESVAIKTKEVSETVYHRAYNPIIFVEEGQNSDTFIKLGNKVFNFKNDTVVETVSPSPKFAYLSSIVEQLEYNHVKECFNVKDEQLGTFSINESGVRKGDDLTINESFDPSAFIKEQSIIVSSISKNTNEAFRNNQVLDSMLSIHYNFDNIVKADNMLMVESLKNNEKFAIILNENQSAYLAVLSSLRYPNILTKFNRIDEAIEALKKHSGYDAKEFFIQAITEQNQLDQKSNMIAEKYNDIIAELEQREIDVKQKINEAKHNRQVNREKALTESLFIIQSAIIEQKQNFAKQF